MEHLTTIKTGFLATIGIVGSFIVQLLGGWTTDLATLALFMAIDFLMGLAVAGIFKNSQKTKNGALKSSASWQGLFRKFVTIVFVVVASRFDMLLGTDYIRTATIIGFLVNEAISIVENAGLMGVPLPPVIIKSIEVLKTKAEGDAKNE